MVEADLDAAPRGRGRRDDPRDLRAADPRRLLDEHVRARLERAMRARRAVVRRRDDRRIGRASEQLVEARAQRCRRTRRRAPQPPRGHVEAADELVATERRRALATDQAAAHDGDASRQLRYSPTRPGSRSRTAAPGRPRRAIAWRVSSGRARVDEQEAAAARADELAADRRRCGARACTAVSMFSLAIPGSAALVLPVLVHQLGVALEVAGLEQPALSSPICFVRSRLSASARRPVSVRLSWSARMRRPPLRVSPVKKSRRLFRSRSERLRREHRAARRRRCRPG